MSERKPKVRFSFDVRQDGYAIWDDESLSDESLSAIIVCEMLERGQHALSRLEAAEREASRE